MSTITTKYLQPASTYSGDASQSPLALLAQTCSSIGKESLSTTPPTITSFVTKSSSSNSDKSLSLTKIASNSPGNKKSTLSLKAKPILSSSSSSFIDRNLFPPPLPPPSFDPTMLFLRSSLAYLSSQQHSYATICTLPGCFQCEGLRHILSNSINPHIYPLKSPSNEQLIEHFRSNHRQRFHPYFKPLNPSDQLSPYFSPRLSTSLMSETTRRPNHPPRYDSDDHN